MADERNVITILVQAIDRATGTFRTTTEKIRELEAAEKKAAAAGDQLDASQKRVRRTKEEHARATERLVAASRREIEQDRRNVEIKERIASALLGSEDAAKDYKAQLTQLRRETENYVETTEDLEAAQLSFFDRVRANNKLLGEQGRLLRDLSGEDIRVPLKGEGIDAFNRRFGQRGFGVDREFGVDRPLFGPRLAGGGFLSSEGADPDQLSLFADALSRLDRESGTTERALSRLDRVAVRLGRSLGETTARFRRLSIAQREGGKSLADFTRFDETLELGLRRLLRLLATLAPLLPFLAVGVGLFLGALTALTGGVAALVGALGSLVGVLATLPGLFAATAGAALAFQAVVGPGITNIVERFKEILALEDQQRKQTTENLNAQRDAAEALADIRTQNAAQLAALDDRIREQRRDGAEEVADQERDLARLKVRNAESEADLVRQLRRARRDAAQEGLDNEREYRELIKENRSDERELAAELSARRATLGSLIQQGADPNRIDAARASAERVESQLQTEIRNNRRQENAALRQSQEQTRNNAEQIADLERRLFRERRNNRQEETDAARELARTRRDNAEELVDLERQRQQLIAQGLRQERDAVQRLNEARRQGAADVEDSLAGLTPSERDIVQRLRRIREEWLSLTAAVRESGLALGSRALAFFESRLPQIASRVNGIASAVIEVGNQALARFTSPERWARLDRILVDTQQNTRVLGEAAIEVADAFLLITDAARPLTRFVATTIRDLAEGFRESVEASEESGGLEQFFQRTQRVLDLTIDALGNLGSALLDVLEIGAPFGEVLLGDFVEWTQRIEDWTSSATGKRAIEEFFEDSLPVFRALAELASEFVESMFRVGRALVRPDIKTGVSLLQTIIEDLTEALPQLENFLIQSTLENGPVLINFLREFGQIIGLLVGPGGALVVLLDVATDVLRLFDLLPEPVERLIVTYLALNGLLLRVGKGIRAIALALGGLLFGTRTAAGRGGLLATLFGGPGIAKLLIITMLIFPQLVNDISNALNRLDRFLSPVTDKIRQLGEAMGITGDDAETLAIQLGFLFLVLRRSGIVAIVTSLGRLVTFFGRFIALARVAGLGTAIAAALRAFRVFSSLERLFVRFGPILGRLGFFVGGITLALDGLNFIARQIDNAFGTNLQSVFLSTMGTLREFARAWEQVIGDISRAVEFLVDQIRNRWPVLIAGALRGIPGAVLAIIGPRLWSFGRDIVTGIWNGIKDNLPGLGDLIGTALGAILPNIDVPGLSPPKEAAAHAIGRPLGQGIKEGALGELDTFGDELGNVLQNQLQNAETLAATAEDDAVRGLAGRIAANMRFLVEALDGAEQELDDFISKVQSLESSVPAFIRAQMSIGEVPARRELASLDRQEELRSRAQRRRDADQELQEARRTQRQREQSLASAVARLNRLRARLAPIALAAAATRAGPGGPSVRAADLTPQQRQALRQQIRSQEQIVAERRRELDEAEKQIREVSARRRETFRQVALEERRERLEQLAITQEEEREKEIQAAERRAAAAIEKFVQGVESGKIQMRDARRELVKALLGAGLTEEQVTAWFQAGNKAGNDFQSGLITSLADVAQTLPKAINAAVTKARIAAQIAAPVVIVADLKTLRRAIFGPQTVPRDRTNVHGTVPGAAAGMRVPGREGQSVPILAHAGEWVLNRSQQWQMALMAGVDRTALQRALFHKLSPRMDFRFAMGGVVPSQATTNIGGTTFLTPINIETASPTVDIEYVSRALQSRISSVIS